MCTSEGPENAAIKNAADKNPVFGLPEAAESQKTLRHQNVLVKVHFFGRSKVENGQKCPKMAIFRFMCTFEGPENGAIKNAADKNPVFGLTEAAEIQKTLRLQNILVRMKTRVRSRDVTGQKGAFCGESKL